MDIYIETMVTVKGIRDLLANGKGYEIYLYVNSCRQVLEPDVLNILEVSELQWLTHQYLDLMIKRGAIFTEETLIKLLPIKGISAEYLARKTMDFGSDLVKKVADITDREEICTYLAALMLVNLIPGQPQ